MGPESGDFGPGGVATVEPGKTTIRAEATVFPHALRDETSDCLDAGERFLDASAMLVRDIECNHGASGYRPGEAEHEAPSSKYVARALRRPGTPRRATASLSGTGALADSAGQALVALVQNLPDPAEQAEVLRRLANAAQGGLMQHAVDAVTRARREQEFANAEAREGYAMVDPESVAADIVAVEQRLTVHSAARQVRECQDLQTRLPRVWDLIITGLLSPWVGGVIAKETAYVTDLAALEEIERRLLQIMEAGKGTAEWSGYLTRRLRQLIAQIDPAATKAAAASAKKDRGVWARPEPHGSVTLDASVDALDAEAIMEAVNGLADRWGRNPREERNIGQRRADALVQLVTGQDRRPPPDGSPDPLVRVPLRPRITVLGAMPGRGTNGANERQRVWVAGAEATRARLDEFLAGADRCSVEVVPDAADDADADLSRATRFLERLEQRLRAETTYAPSADLQRRVRERDGTCRHPGCGVPAERCDLDHVEPLAHGDPGHGGLTREGNMMALCRKHHRLKTHGNAEYRLGADGKVTAMIGETCEGHSYPQGLRGDQRAQAGRLYAAYPADYANRLKRIGLLADSLGTLVENALGGADAARADSAAAEACAREAASANARGGSAVDRPSDVAGPRDMPRRSTNAEAERASRRRMRRIVRHRMRRTVEVADERAAELARWPDDVEDEPPY